MNHFLEELHKVVPSLTFTIVDVGARRGGKFGVPRYTQLLQVFPGSHVIGFEADGKSCEQMNRDASLDETFICATIGNCRQSRPFYEANRPECSSLYRPHDILPSGLRHFLAPRLKSTKVVQTVSLDEALAEHNIKNPDFLMLDVQGAELDVLQGATKTLSTIKGIVSEAQFQPLYAGVPLFGDVCNYLTTQGYYFFRFLSLTPNASLGELAKVTKFSPQMWGDAFFMPDFDRLERLSLAGRLKLAVFAHYYGLVDITIALLLDHDRRQGTELGAVYRAELNRLLGEAQ